MPSPNAEFRGEGGYKRLADRLNSSGEMARKVGLRMGYHNHNAEFATSGAVVRQPDTGSATPLKTYNVTQSGNTLRVFE